MELILNRPLQWFVCQLHVNELPLRRRFAHVDRITTGRKSLTGEIRKSLAGCEKLFLVSSTPIEYTLCEVTNKKDLKVRSTLFHMSLAILRRDNRFLDGASSIQSSCLKPTLDSTNRGFWGPQSSRVMSTDVRRELTRDRRKTFLPNRRGVERGRPD
ncbi:hypothetical protein AVEN_51174-1 [Araneus ventricosus]|uniref:Uncharacterized protein n=1 Tax=Araneus ventricosus TaxID=182803 RepID=A0A4Y2PPW4_ARAVE|nr:hypothetical protein AVEN_51174-1 [Araneus ventricosus]